MYDTVSAVLTEVPPEVTERRRWQRSREDIDVETGELVQKLTTNADGCLLTLYGGGRAMKVERSLPKAYRGQNIEDLYGPAVSVALGVLDGEVAEALGYWDLPTVATWAPSRVDYPESQDLGDEAAVRRQLAKWSSTEIPYKGLPVVGQAGTVTWSKGDIKLKAYGKYAETKHDPRALGLLRIEPGVFRLRQFRALLGRESDEEVALSEVLTADMHERVHAKFRDRLRGDVMTAKEIGDLDLFRELLGLYGARRTASLLGWSAMYGMTGVRSRADMLASPLGSLPTRYRVLADLRAFRLHLLAKGYVLSDVATEDADIEALAHRLHEVAA